MASITIDESRFPIVVVRFDGTATDAEFQAYLAGMEKMMRTRRTKNCTILDATRAGDTPAKQRRMQAEWLKANDDMLRRYSVGSAFVITSAFVRGLLTAILWMQPMAAPHTIVATMHEAERWAREQLAKAEARLST